MDRLISCEFNMDTACVELKFANGSIIAIDTIAVENKVADNMYQRSELDYLIYNMVIQLTPLQSPVYRTAVLSELQYDRTKEAEICQSASRSGSASKLLPRNMPPKVIATLTSRRLVGQRALSALSVAVKSIVNSPAVCTSAMNAIIRLLSPPAHSCIVAVCP